MWVSIEIDPPNNWEYLVLWEYWIASHLYTKWYWYAWDSNIWEL